MAKRKSDFHPLTFINPFDNKNFENMVYKDWAIRENFVRWRVSNSKWLKDPKLIDLLDVDELLSQWDVDPKERKVNPDTCYMIFKEFSLVLRMVDAEHQDALFNHSIPGVVYSSSSNKYIYMKYDIDAYLTSGNPNKAVKVEQFNTEQEAYEAYKNNRDELITLEASKALAYSLIDPEVYDKYFGYSDTPIKVRDYEYYRKKEETI